MKLKVERLLIVINCSVANVVEISDLKKVQGMLEAVICGVVGMTYENFQTPPHPPRFYSSLQTCSLYSTSMVFTPIQ